ncbi:acetyl-CoA carboxylase biotin carboxyl carrier protein [Novosphingobium pokkalii]|uniref:Biotin carboxyl carrier protein of acetyl-CoA carboxylase n=1 Tax=Novosphingobium pokkalii TaxID=1770194 RepID=A0ABV7V291_9SPHN|nr:biotin/lipoyl-containing protein [Novosphingobium pokkalii]GHC82320.1 acetyl-CoA carboxylase biotin carboxyl carrier protein subunit [Novosphingobium pokkalii]
MIPDLPLTAEDVAEIAEILAQSGYRELDLATRRFRLRVARAGDGSAEGTTQEWQWAGDAPAVAEAAGAEAVADPDVIASPLPGTFYHAPQPGAPPFVAVGDAVTADTVVGIVETMKLMNPVHAGRAGTVAAVLAANGALVAKGAPLVRLS